MRIGPALPFERRAAVELLLRDTTLTFVEIGARTGVHPGTVATWNVRAGRPRPRRRGRRDGPAAWKSARREALVRLYREPRNDPGDLAEAAGLGRRAAVALFGALGEPPRPAGSAAGSGGLAPLDAAAAADAPSLRAQLRAHIARQIAAFDAALRGEGAAVLDSARVLRDLGGLKRLFDEVVRDDPAAAGGAGTGTGAGASADRGSGDGGRGPDLGQDLAALRAEVARRYARFVGGGDAG